MKNLLKLLVLAIFGMTVLAGYGTAARKKSDWLSIKKSVTVKVEGISSADSAKLREKLKKVKGVSKVRVSVKKEEVSAELDISKITENKFVEKIESLGYEAELVR